MFITLAFKILTFSVNAFMTRVLIESVIMFDNFMVDILTEEKVASNAVKTETFAEDALIRKLSE